jgi:hypothetical protein
MPWIHTHCCTRTSGLPDFSWYNIPKREKPFQITIKYTEWPQNIPNGRKNQHLPLQDPPKIGIFGLKICHLATLMHIIVYEHDLVESLFTFLSRDNTYFFCLSRSNPTTSVFTTT